MFIVYEYAACVLAVSIGMTMMFTACVLFLGLEEGCAIVVRKMQMLTNVETSLLGRWTEARPREE